MRLFCPLVLPGVPLQCHKAVLKGVAGGGGGDSCPPPLISGNFIVAQPYLCKNKKVISMHNSAARAIRLLN